MTPGLRRRASFLVAVALAIMSTALASPDVDPSPQEQIHAAPSAAPAAAAPPARQGETAGAREDRWPKMELLVFVEQLLPLTATDWQRYCDEHHIPITIDPHVDMTNASGNGVSVEINEHQAQFEMFTGPKELLRGTGLDKKFSLRKYHAVYAFRVSIGSWNIAGAFDAAACIAMALNGEVFDPVEGKALDVKKLAKIATYWGRH